MTILQQFLSIADVFVMMKMTKEYVQTFRFEWMIQHYDWLINTFTPNEEIKSHLISQAAIEANHSVLDFGCGTGDLAIRAKRANLEANVMGIDIDRNALENAKKKAAKLELEIPFLSYEGDKLPYEDLSFDKVLSGFVFHHLKDSQRKQSLSEIYRVLKSGAELHIVDFGKPANLLMRCAYVINQLLDGFENTRDIGKGALPSYLESAGFRNVIHSSTTYNTVVGTVHFYSGMK